MTSAGAPIFYRAMAFYLHNTGVMKTFMSLLIGVAIGFGLYWYLAQHPSSNFLTRARDDLQQTATNVDESVKQTFDSNKIKDEMARTGRVVRDKAAQAGNVIADAATNARITTDIKARLVADSRPLRLQNQRGYDRRRRDPLRRRPVL